MLEIHSDNFAQEVEQRSGPMVLDFWGPQCGPCLALMPEVETLAKSYEGKVAFGKVNVSGNRRLCIQLKVMSVPTFLFFQDGRCTDRLSGDAVTPAAIRAKAEALAG